MTQHCEICGAYLPQKFIFLPDQVPKVIEFSCSKCGARYAFKSKVGGEKSVH